MVPTPCVRNLSPSPHGGFTLPGEAKNEKAGRTVSPHEGTTEREGPMIMRIVTFMVAGAVALFLPVAFAAAASTDGDGARDTQAFIRRDDDDDVELAVAERDDDDSDDGDTDTNSNSRWSSNVDSNDRTNSRKTPVSRDRNTRRGHRDLSRDDKTRDFTRDGGSRTRDRSRNRTNDRSRNDTR